MTAGAALLGVAVVLGVRFWPAPAAAPLESAHAPPVPAAPPPPPWIASWWAFPLAPQGPSPAGWTALEARLDPDACGACHVTQLADWRASLHAAAMGPGVLGQLVDWDPVAPDGAATQGRDQDAVARCQTCHAPLAEQSPRTPAYDASLRPSGVTCAACHVRAHARSGPPLPDGQPPVADAPHGGFTAEPAFQDPDFCAPCHDFAPGQRALAGKLLQETGAEWRTTEAAAAGTTCQGCHMEGGRHRWKGIHDPDMVRRAFTATLAPAGVGATLTVTNTGAAHRMPTYSTPQLTLVIEQVDATGETIAGTAVQRAIARYLKPDLSEELFDTRLLPGESLTLTYDRAPSPTATALRARVECWPDEAYRRFYTIKLKDPAYGPQGRSAIEAALANSVASRFVAWEGTLPLPPAGAR